MNSWSNKQSYNEHVLLNVILTIQFIATGKYYDKSFESLESLVFICFRNPKSPLKTEF